MPHWEQNLAPATSVAPQLAQASLSADPHAEQNLAVAALALLQFEQTMGPGDASLADAVATLVTRRVTPAGVTIQTYRPAGRATFGRVDE